MRLTLEHVLKTQDLGKVQERCQSVLDGTYERGKDPITDIIINAFEENDNEVNESFETDIEYAISQLKRVLTLIAHRK